MTLRIHNTLSRATEVFVPIEPGHVRLYVCGITIYDHSHMGHARFMVAFDVAQRWMKTLGYRVTYVRNITDVDDKIIKRALERGVTLKALTDEMIAALHEDADALGIERPTHEPRATHYVPQMLEMIATLEKKGLGYRVASGDTVAEPLFLERRNHLEHLRHIVRGARLVRRPLDAEGVGIFMKRGDHLVGKGLQRDASLERTLDDLVVDVGDVADIGDPVAERLHPALRHVERHHEPGVAHMRVVVDRDAANVQANVSRLDRNKDLGRPRQGVVNSKCHGADTAPDGRRAGVSRRMRTLQSNQYSGPSRRDRACVSPRYRPHPPPRGKPPVDESTNARRLRARVARALVRCRRTSSCRAR